jgi:hypothetical protein
MAGCSFRCAKRLDSLKQALRSPAPNPSPAPRERGYVASSDDLTDSAHRPSAVPVVFAGGKKRRSGGFCRAPWCSEFVLYHLFR